ARRRLVNAAMLEALRQRAGCWRHERWRTECALSPALSRLSGISWLDLCNRHERLAEGSGAEARVCQWRFSSMLTVARVFPEVGSRLLRRAMREWPFALSDDPLPSTTPRVSVVIPVGGRDRLPLFLGVVKSFRAQSVRDVEVIAVEHSA